MTYIYEYNGKHYCETDLSRTDENYFGDLYYLYCALLRNGKADESTIYYPSANPECVYESVEDMIEDYFSELIIGEVTSDD